MKELRNTNNVECNERTMSNVNVRSHCLFFKRGAASNLMKFLLEFCGQSFFSNFYIFCSGLNLKFAQRFLKDTHSHNIHIVVTSSVVTILLFHTAYRSLSVLQLQRHGTPK